MNVSSMPGMLDPCGARPGIMIAYGHATAGRILRGGRTAELLPGGGAARRDPARGQPPDPVAREAARFAAARSPGPSRRADRSRSPPLPERAARARLRGA